MEKVKDFRKKLNLTQEDMAMIYKISRSEYALYELGLRKLSAIGLTREVQVQRFFDTSADPEAKQIPQIVAEELRKSEFIADALKRNEVQQLVCERKIKRAKKEYKAVLMLLQLIDFLSHPSDKKTTMHPGELQILKEKADKAIYKYGPHQLLKLEVQQELLKKEKVLLTELLK